MKKQTPFFAFNKRRKHPSYIFKEKDSKYHNILITHSREDKKRKNVPLYKNPNPNDSSNAYIKKRICVDDKKYIDFKKSSFKYWSFHLFDKRKIKKIKNEQEKNKKRKCRELLT